MESSYAPIRSSTCVVVQPAGVARRVKLLDCLRKPGAHRALALVSHVRRPPAAPRRRTWRPTRWSARGRALSSGCSPCLGMTLRRLWRLVVDFLLQRLPDGFVADKPLCVRSLLTRRIEACLAVRNLGDWFLLAHRSP